jgi:hypothetical protein
MWRKRHKSDRCASEVDGANPNGFARDLPAVCPGFARVVVHLIRGNFGQRTVLCEPKLLVCGSRDVPFEMLNEVAFVGLGEHGVRKSGTRQTGQNRRPVPIVGLVDVDCPIGTLLQSPREMSRDTCRLQIWI